MHLTPIPPPVCSSCGGAHPDLRHVDFEAAWDGPSFPQGVTMEEGHTRTNLIVSIDDLILCETCIAQAAKLIGLGDTTEVRAELITADLTVKDLRERLGGQADYIESLEQQVRSLGSLKQMLTGGKPKQKQAA